MKKPPATTTGIYKATLDQLRQYAAPRGWPLIHAIKIAVDKLTKAK